MSVRMGQFNKFGTKALRITDNDSKDAKHSFENSFSTKCLSL